MQFLYYYNFSYDLSLFSWGEMESLCISVIQKIKNALDRPEDVMVDRTIGVWMGELPGSLRKAQSIDIQSVVSDSGEASSSQMPIVSNSRKAMIFHSGAPSWTDTSASAGSLVGENMGMEMTSAQDIGSYQVYCAVSYIIIFMNINSRV